MPYTLPELPYEFNSLEPYIDAQTMEIHYSKHHQAYLTNLNSALEDYQNLQVHPIDVLLTKLTHVPDHIRIAVRNNGGGHFNHSLFWECMTPQAPAPSDELLRKINGAFGTFDQFKEQFTATAMGRFGSGWAWLVEDGERLAILSTANQDNPITEGKKPILGLDVWEHAYYLKYQNRRAEYVQNWWNVVNWSVVEQRLM